MVVIHIWYCLEEYYTSCTITPQRTLEALYKRLWFPSSKSTSFWNGALVNVLSLWKKAEEKKWKQRYWVLAVCECNARGLYFKKNWWPYIMDSDIEIIFIGFVAVHTLFFTVTPPHPTPLHLLTNHDPPLYMHTGPI